MASSPASTGRAATLLASTSAPSRLRVNASSSLASWSIAFLAGGSRFLTFEEQTNHMHAAARALGRQLIVLECRSEQDFNAAFTSIVERGAGALVVGVFPLFFD